MIVGHIVHDLRGRAEAEADRDAAAALASRCGLGFVESSVSARAAGGNAEAAARRLRYAELSRLAAEAGCGFVATAHQADDQLETLLMRLLRGAGPGGLGGIAPRRPLANGVMLIRPMLGATRADSEALCAAAGWAWQEDATNRDETRLRARLRRRVIPELRAISPDVAGRAARSMELLRGAGEVVEARAAALLARAARDEAGGLVWARADFRLEPEVIVGSLLRVAAARVSGGAGADRAGRGVVDRAVRAVRDGRGGKRVLRIGSARLTVESREVRMERVEES